MLHVPRAVRASASHALSDGPPAPKCCAQVRCPSGAHTAVVPKRWCPSSAQAAGGGPQLAAAATSSSRAACPRGWGSTLPSGRAQRSRCWPRTHCRTRPRRGRRERPSGRHGGRPSAACPAGGRRRRRPCPQALCRAARLRPQAHRRPGRRCPCGRAAARAARAAARAARCRRCSSRAACPRWSGSTRPPGSRSPGCPGTKARSRRPCRRWAARAPR
mmetsp:Transcript_67556/g.163330  ORF Transcript_67556/g.163330 Transcript_67556/m.163330 type:complete len:217 (-) Transcript_67556:1616-2266(-)